MSGDDAFRLGRSQCYRKEQCIREEGKGSGVLGESQSYDTNSKARSEATTATCLTEKYSAENARRGYSNRSVGEITTGDPILCVRSIHRRTRHAVGKPFPGKLFAGRAGNNGSTTQKATTCFVYEAEFSRFPDKEAERPVNKEEASHCAHRRYIGHEKAKPACLPARPRSSAMFFSTTRLRLQLVPSSLFVLFPLRPRRKWASVERPCRSVSNESKCHPSREARASLGEPWDPHSSRRFTRSAESSADSRSLGGDDGGRSRKRLDASSTVSSLTSAGLPRTTDTYIVRNVKAVRCGQETCCTVDEVGHQR